MFNIYHPDSQLVIPIYFEFRNAFLEVNQIIQFNRCGQKSVKTTAKPVLMLANREVTFAHQFMTDRDFLKNAKSEHLIRPKFDFRLMESVEWNR